MRVSSIYKMNLLPPLPLICFHSTLYFSYFFFIALDFATYTFFELAIPFSYCLYIYIYIYIYIFLISLRKVFCSPSPPIVFQAHQFNCQMIIFFSFFFICLEHLFELIRSELCKSYGSALHLCVLIQ